MPRAILLHIPVTMAELRGAQSENLKGGCPGLGIGKHSFSVLLEQRKTAEDHHPCPHLAFSPPVLFHSSKHSISEHCVISPWIITFGGCRQRYRTENKTAGGAAGAEEHGSSQHKLICTLERNYSHLGVVLKPANSIHNFRAVPVLLVSTSRDERKLATNI